MNHDPVYNRLRELSWRRSLNESEQAELRAWLVAHPEAQAEWEVETDLSAMLHQLPDAPVPSNFAARVLKSVERETSPQRRPGSGWAWRWRVFLPRVAGVAAVIGFSFFGYHQYTVVQQTRLVRKLAETPAVANPALWEDFEAIRQLGSSPAPDEELLALMK